MQHGTERNSLSRHLICLAMLLVGHHVTQATVPPQPGKSAYVKMRPVGDVTFTEDVLWEKPARSPIDCSVKCMGETGCTTLTYTPGPDGSAGRCRVYSRHKTPADGQQSAPGARTFVLLPSDVWIKTPCDTSSDCTEPVAGCFSGQCLCSQGYFWEHAQNACVSSCAWGLDNAYLQYTGMDLYSQDTHQVEEMGIDPVTSCQPICSAYPECKGFVYSTYYSGCYFRTVTAQELPLSWFQKATCVFYQRTCL